MTTESILHDIRDAYHPLRLLAKMPREKGKASKEENLKVNPPEKKIKIRCWRVFGSCML